MVALLLGLLASLGSLFDADDITDDLVDQLGADAADLENYEQDFLTADDIEDVDNSGFSDSADIVSDGYEIPDYSKVDLATDANTAGDASARGDDPVPMETAANTVDTAQDDLEIPETDDEDPVEGSNGWGWQVPGVFDVNSSDDTLQNTSWDDVISGWDNGQGDISFEDSVWDFPTMGGLEIVGDAHNNLLSGFDGDTMTGNAGRDVFEVMGYHPSDTAVTITDFDRSENEAIVVTSSQNFDFDDVTQTKMNGGVMLEYNGNQIAFVHGVESLTSEELIIGGLA